MHFDGVNPWISMWSQPRVAIRALLEKDPKYGVVWLSTIFALQNLFYFANLYSIGLDSRFYMVLIAILALSPLFGLAWLYYAGWILRFTGKWLGGITDMLSLRCALAWSKVPQVLSLAMWLVLLASGTDGVFIQSAIGQSLVFVNLIVFILWIWTSILLIQSIREAQGFTLARALGNVILYKMISSLIILSTSLALGVVLGLSVRYTPTA